MASLVSIHRYSPSDLLRRWLRRHRVAVTLSAALLAALVASAMRGCAGWSASGTPRVRAQAETAARENALTLMQAERSLADDPTAAVAWLKRHQPTADKAWVARAPPTKRWRWAWPNTCSNSPRRPARWRCP